MFYNFQFGFRENYSIGLAVAKMCNEVIKNLESNKITCSIFLDLVKALDTVDYYKNYTHLVFEANLTIYLQAI